MKIEKIGEVKNIMVYLPLNDHASLKVYTAKRGVTISELIRDLITNLLKEDK